MSTSIVPPFDPCHHKPEVRFVWWSWHPRYPYWSKSCWDGSTEAEAWEAFNKPLADKLRSYHNKLIREGDGAFTEVYDLPCQRMDDWNRAVEREKAKALKEAR